METDNREIDLIALEYNARPLAEMLERASAFQQEMARRRSVRHFSDEPVPLELIEQVVRTASTATSAPGRSEQPGGPRSA